MSNRVGSLRLGPLPKTEMVKLTIAVTAETKSELDRYAALHSQLHGEAVDASILIPHMLEAFMAKDRGFRSMCANAAGATKPLPQSPLP